MKKISNTLFILLIAIIAVSSTIDLNSLSNYESQVVPFYITADNTGANEISDEGATLGRVLFYDKNLSLNNTTSCASCHLQEFAFGDTAIVSEGFDGGLTERHSMRLVNGRFAEEPTFFWDERADSLEMQATMPIKDHIEMGFSGTNGQPDFDSLVTKLSALDYYSPLFLAAFGDTIIDEDKVQKSLAQFMRSIQSFDSKYDVGRAQVAGDFESFPNYTASENNGKQLFMLIGPDGAHCAQCHKPPEFQIDPASLNNGIIGVAGNPLGIDLTNTRSPSLRDIVNPNGDLNGPLMHDGSISTLAELIAHYNLVPQDPNNTNLDQRLFGPEGDLQLTPTEKQDLINFLKTLTGSDIYTNEKWSDPFDANGNIDIIPLITGLSEYSLKMNVSMYPNPTSDILNIESSVIVKDVEVYTTGGKLIHKDESCYNKKVTIDVSNWQEGVYVVRLTPLTGLQQFHKIIKR